MKSTIPRARIERFSRAILRQHRISVVNVESADRQYLVDWRSTRQIKASPKIMSALCDISHRWVIYIGAFCIDASGKRYMKSTEIAPDGIYRSESLAEVLEHCYRELIAGCNPNQLVGSGWIATPGGDSMDEEQAFRIFEACGGWTVGAATDSRAA